MKHSISSRLALMFVLLMVIILSTLALFQRASLSSSLENQMHNELLFRNSLVAPYIETQGSQANWHLIQEKLKTLSDNEGHKVKYSIISDDSHYQIGGSLLADLRSERLKDGFSTMPGEEKHCPLYLYVETLKSLGNRPEIRFVVAIDSTPYFSTLSEFSHALILISLAGLILVAILSYAISRIGMSPVRDLSRQANFLIPGNVGQRLNSSALPSELQSLAYAFNGVLERQEIAWQQLESFNADVAHELRTPLTNLLGQTQLALARERSVHELEELLQSNLEELARMTSIVNDMLFLSHAQAGKSAAELSNTSLREEALKTAEYVEPSFHDRELKLDIVGNVQTIVDRRLFHRALANLLENSARHAIPSTTVTVSINAQYGFVHVAVMNVGDTIATRHLSRLFERFYRVDASRKDSDMHHGLGLAIVKAIAIMHGGEVFARSEKGINTFGFTLRVSPKDNIPS
ncbi:MULTISPECIES: heavy metal sensor histidine kinase [Citrobacter]|uniref:heavy metal sensor histidine kinase n=1 Tax=Citrobacter TaxID=544 RepID=UPI000E3D0154|nr:MULTISPECIES: heavy metal sensor histidine kinase [Citrobacter]MBD0826603.1 heavy metal sensor histidine kinase [Citrobacter sp. C1]RFU93326.1 HAMP domain-containing protein [Citrobacter gillenii]